LLQGESGLERLIRQARENPQFFHDLVFNTENILAKLDYLDRKTKASILSTPEEVIAIMVRRGIQPRYNQVKVGKKENVIQLAKVVAI
jgi:hypothetical protein